MNYLNKQSRFIYSKVSTKTLVKYNNSKILLLKYKSEFNLSIQSHKVNKFNSFMTFHSLLDHHLHH